MNAFHLWVANTIAQCGGNGAAYLQDVQRKWLLTCVESRMNACQGGFEQYFTNKKQAFMRFQRIVPTNLTVYH